jgi:gamma-glutamylcyclotransferase (GGCT)/AIG2-like uncharacterized protein YtfP
MTANAHLTIRLFVYGSLKRGYWNHGLLGVSPTSIDEAKAWGRLYDLKAGFPALEVPTGSILSHGRSEPLADAKSQQEARISDFDQPRGDWDLIHGELITLSNPSIDLPRLDLLEGFNPGDSSLYQRVLIPVSTEVAIASAWTYTMRSIQQGTRLTEGWWSPCR